MKKTCSLCRHCVADELATDYRRDDFYFCEIKGPFFSRNYRLHEGTRISPQDPACEHFEKKPTFAAVVVAAGSSSRMGAGKSKLLLEILGEPVLAYTLKVFDKTPLIERLVLVAREEEREQFIPLLIRHFHKPYCIVCGGATRQQSVLNGIEAVKDADYYVIHDGARPLVTPDEVTAVCVDAVLNGAATLAVPSKDTCKLADTDGFVTGTPDRSALWAVQTPQVFEAAQYLAASERSRAEGKDFTDDCQLIEYNGGRVHLCRGSYENLKITTPEDLVLAEAILSKRMEENK